MPAQRVRLACCLMLGAWELSWHIALFVRNGGEDDQIESAKFFHKTAAHRLQSGNREGAIEAARIAAETSPAYRSVLLEDPLIKELM
ncbi:hypothetical protein OJ996_25940 [Luteolibacter sp. GHJ8]|uniref:Tetratricopeptide repeat protein n=1 Tax=Luteolibacter rhizosphaerae TaxID=2989719 RepID=A0ABT3GB45_9BACT|nr:hypothetical protein [Luteolibacter rhizosphaerae]